MVAYNGSRFDFPFLFACCNRYAVKYSVRILYELDPLQIVNSLTLNPIPRNKKLGTMYKYITNSALVNAHNAEVDVCALLVIFVHPPIWQEREKFVVERKKLKKIISAAVLQSVIEHVHEKETAIAVHSS